MFDTPNTTDTTDTYRTYVNAHYELVPYMYTNGVQAFESNYSAILPRVSSSPCARTVGL